MGQQICTEHIAASTLRWTNLKNSRKHKSNSPDLEFKIYISSSNWPES